MPKRFGEDSFKKWKSLCYIHFVCLSVGFATCWRARLGFYLFSPLKKTHFLKNKWRKYQKRPQDPDQPDKLLSDFEVTLSGQGSDTFSLERNPRGGYSLVLVKGLDREDVEQYRLALVAADRKGGQTANLELELRSEYDL